MFEVAYPSTLPPMSGAPQWAPDEAAARTSLPGAAIGRQRSAAPHRLVQALWRYSAAQMQVWRDWFNTDLRGGAQWFTMPVVGRGGALSCACRFVGGTVRRSALAGGLWEVTAQIMVRSQSAAISAAAFVEDFSAGLAPYTTQSGSAARYAIEGTPLGPALRFPSVLSGPVTYIERPVASILVRKIEVVFKLDAYATDDAPVLELYSGSDRPVSITPQREGTSAAVLFVLAYGNGTIGITNGNTQLGVWHRFEMDLAPGVGATAWRTYNHNTNALLDSDTLAPQNVAAPPFVCTAMRFRVDSTFANADASYRSVRLG